MEEQIGVMGVIENPLSCLSVSGEDSSVQSDGDDFYLRFNPIIAFYNLVFT
jgi:hypothetical protein